MGNRLSKIYTRTGDEGMTGLGDGSRVAKNDARIRTLGAIDETNSLIGILINQSDNKEIDDMLTKIQHRLFDLGGELSIPDRIAITEKHVNELEEWLDNCNADLAPLKNFILPGGSQSAAFCHLARSVCRRAESEAVNLNQQNSQTINPQSLKYLNRLSDLLFVLSRTFNRQAKQPDVLWQPGL
ncbi:MAG: cob(I)yrinic acid a,c-diamide adenosyltransferase [Gammaproteobacteria bacterium]